MTIFKCPMPGCDWAYAEPAGDDPVTSAAVASVMGMPANGFAALREHQAKRRTELELQRHCQTHPVVEWAVALGNAQRMIRQAHTECLKHVGDIPTNNVALNVIEILQLEETRS